MCNKLLLFFFFFLFVFFLICQSYSCFTETFEDFYRSDQAAWDSNISVSSFTCIFSDAELK